MKRPARASEQLARAALPDMIEVLVVGVRSGMSPTTAFEMAVAEAPPVLHAALEPSVRRLHRGHRLADALTELPASLGPQAVYFADTLITADRYGLPIGPVLDQLMVEVRADRVRQAALEARTLPVKLAFPLVVCTLPSFVLLAIVPAVMGAVSTLRGLAP